MQHDEIQLAGKLLIAMPGLGDPRFAQAVVLICAHSPASAMGLIINKPSSELAFPALLGHLGIAAGPNTREIGVHYGGPVERGRGFVLHSEEWQGTAAPPMTVPGGFKVTSTLDVMEAMAEGQGPEQALLALGYAGWGHGQLEDEIRRSDWLVVDASAALVFEAEARLKWSMALRCLGVDPLMLSPTAGRA